MTRARGARSMEADGEPGSPALLDAGERASSGGVLLRLGASVVALGIAVAVLFGVKFPWSDGASPTRGGRPLVTVSADVAGAPRSVPTATGTPFVLRTPAVIYATTTPVPGSAAAQAAASEPCMELR